MPTDPTRGSIMTTTTTKATTSTITMTAITTMPNDIKKAFGKALRQKDSDSRGTSRGSSGGGGSEGSGGGGGAAPQQQVILSAQDKWIMEQLPSVFDRDRTKANAFMEEVKSYLRLNAGVNGFYSPMKKMVFVLTLIKGNNVQGWAKDMGKIFDALNPLIDNIPDVWNHFCDEFANQFLDTAEQETARINLQKLWMDPGKINQYISKFKELARRANYTVDNEETAQLFLEGLTTQVMQDVLTTDRLHGYEDYK
jgi:Retrotransposon gag protein